MKNILQQFEALVTNLNKKNEFLKARITLTLFYILGISIILFILSLAIYWLFSQAIDLQTLFQNNTSAIKHFTLEGYGGDEVIHELKEKLLNIILWVDLVIIFISSFFAYFLAKKTLTPIEKTLMKHKQFSSDVAHELRTPLSVLKSGIEYTLLKKRKPEEYVSLLKEQHEEIDYLVDLSNNLLESLSVQHKEINKNNCDLSNLCEKQSQLMKKYFEQRNITLTTDIKQNIFAYIDEIKIKRVLYNILKNAVEYNKKGGSVSLSICGDEKNIIITVADTGIGIESTDLENIFDQFYKADNSRTKNNGAGLGLYLAKEIIESHGGTLICTSTLTVGSIFTVIIPKK